MVWIGLADPQFASVNGVIVLGSSGNFTLLWNVIPNLLVPFKYRITRLHASRWPEVAQWLYRDNILTAVAMSGIVDVDSHCRDPVSCCILRVILACVAESYDFLGILSIG